MVAVTTRSQVEPSHSHESVPCGPKPSRTTRPRRTSYAIPWPERGLGPCGGCKASHVVPSHSHVSPREPLPAAPPNKTTRLRRQSYAIAWPDRAEGLAAGALCDQLPPSHSHVSA